MLWNIVAQFVTVMTFVRDLRTQTVNADSGGTSTARGTSMVIATPRLHQMHSHLAGLAMIATVTRALTAKMQTLIGVAAIARRCMFQTRRAE
jgi:hypothetical protein